jgi:N-sulfoglucosamine sulfohydrolase
MTNLTEKGRDFILIGKERHDLGRPDDKGYPIRGIVTDEYLYLVNYYPERWPAGNPETGYMNCDGSPTKTWILNDRRANGESWYWDMNFGKRPSEELYDLNSDPLCLVNLADDPSYRQKKNELLDKMTSELKAQGDPESLVMEISLRHTSMPSLHKGTFTTGLWPERN